MKVLLAVLLSLAVLVGPLGAPALAGAHGGHAVGHPVADAPPAAGEAADPGCCDRHDRDGGPASCALHALLGSTAKAVEPPAARGSAPAAPLTRAREARSPTPPHGPPRAA